MQAIGGNCGNGPGEIEGVILGMHRTRTDIPLVAKSNAGMPEIVDGEAVYSGTTLANSVYASIRYTGRLATDTLGTMPQRRYWARNHLQYLGCG